MAAHQSGALNPSRDRADSRRFTRYPGKQYNWFGAFQVIASFGDRATEDLYHGRRSSATRRLPADIHASALRKLDMRNATRSLQDLLSPPGNRLEGLRGGLRGYYSIRINDQWRIIFRWISGDAHGGQITDYH